jgi:DNA-binding winged helix-turn-helix (wHTH) protein/class 3 adenylate cyclase
MIYRFGHYQIDTLTCELYQDGRLCKVETRAFEILVYLIEHRDHIVSREELVESLWPGQIISQAAINNGIKAARQAIGDSGGSQHTIRTLHGRGYRFVAQAQRLVTPMGQAAPPRDRPLSSPCAGAGVDSGTMSQNVLVGEYRFVTVLCGTLEPPETLWAQLGVERVQRLRRRFFALAKAEAKQHGATFKFYGADGFLILWGLPVAHADHAKRAARSGLRIREGLGACLDAREAPSPAAASVRLGLHSGAIDMQGSRGHGAWTPLTTSEMAARAVWLHDRAEGGTFLCSQSALPDLRETVEYVEQGVIPIPQHEQPMMAYRIDGL